MSSGPTEPCAPRGASDSIWSVWRQDHNGNYLEIKLLLITSLVLLTVPGCGFRHTREMYVRSRAWKICGALEPFRIDIGRLPSAAEGLAVLVDPPPGSRWEGDGGYLKPEDLIDWWGERYQYRPDPWTMPSRSSPPEEARVRSPSRARRRQHHELHR